MTVEIIIGDMRERLRGIVADSIDSCVTDPPYHLTSGNVSTDWSSFKTPKGTTNKDGRGHKAPSRGFMGQQWDGGDVAFQPATWAEVLRVMKPGAHLVAFSGTRTYHRMVCAIEDAGFEIRDQLAWVYGSGFPKSHDVSKGIDRIAPRLGQFDAFAAHFAECRKVSGKSQKEIALLFPSKTGGQTGCVWNWENGANVPTLEQWKILQPLIGLSDEWADLIARVEAEREVIGQRGGNLLAVAPGQNNDRSATTLDITAPATEAAQQWQGWGTALKPAWEPICLARVPLIGTVAANVLEYGTGALNIDGCRIEGESIKTTNGGTNEIYGDLSYNAGTSWESHIQGRWPANIIHDGSEEVLAGFPETGPSSDAVRVNRKISEYGFGDGKEDGRLSFGFADNGGSAARFFYCSKADASERHIGGENSHPTVKPLDLMRWLVTLVTPKGGTVLDPFAGSGSTLIAADRAQFNAIGIELSPEYAEIARKRLSGDRGGLLDAMEAA